jgi:pyrroline-5-carboxylate reductase
MPLLFWQREQLFLRYIRASMQAGIEIGFDWKTALYFGTNRKRAAEMLMEEQVHPEQLIDRVTTLKGLHHCRT